MAYQRLLKLIQRDPQNERVYFNLGMIAMDDQDYKSAEKWFRKVSAGIKNSFDASFESKVINELLIEEVFPS